MQCGCGVQAQSWFGAVLRVVWVPMASRSMCCCLWECALTRSCAHSLPAGYFATGAAGERSGTAYGGAGAAADRQGACGWRATLTTKSPWQSAAAHTGGAVCAALPACARPGPLIRSTQTLQALQARDERKTCAASLSGYNCFRTDTSMITLHPHSLQGRGGRKTCGGRGPAAAAPPGPPSSLRRRSRWVLGVYLI